MSDPAPQSCQCALLGPVACVPMGGEGLDELVFATVDPVIVHGAPQWWLYLARCHACGADWLIAEESRIYDVHLMKRLAPGAARAIVKARDWPGDFLTYERTLATARAMTNPPRFFDPMAHGLQFTVEDLRNERRGITIDEIAHLLGITRGNARMLYWKVRLFGCRKLPA